MEAIQEKKEGAYLVGGQENGQPEYYALEVTRSPDGTLWSAWKPSKDDLELLNAGEPIRIGLLTDKQPPIIVEVRPREPSGRIDGPPDPPPPPPGRKCG